MLVRAVWIADNTLTPTGVEKKGIKLVFCCEKGLNLPFCPSDYHRPQALAMEIKRASFLAHAFPVGVLLRSLSLRGFAWSAHFAILHRFEVFRINQPLTPNLHSLQTLGFNHLPHSISRHA